MRNNCLNAEELELLTSDKNLRLSSSNDLILFSFFNFKNSHTPSIKFQIIESV